MLVLSRHADEEIVIGDNIVLKVIEVRNGKVRIGIEAPRTLTVHRREIYDAIKKAQLEGTAGDDSATGTT
jgi:carbon storage regulator